MSVLSLSPRVQRGIACAVAATVGVGILGLLDTRPAAAAATIGTSLSVFAGDGTQGALTPGPAADSQLQLPNHLAAAGGTGKLYVGFHSSSTNANSLAVIDASGDIDYAMNSSGTPGAPTPGAALASPFGAVAGLAADAAGNTYIGDRTYHRVVKVDVSGQLSIIAGNGSASSAFAPTTAGVATSKAVTPRTVAVGPDGAVFVADQNNRQILKIDTVGNLTVVAGTSLTGAPTPGTSGAPIAATASPFTTVLGLAVDSTGNVFISDQTGACVTMIDSSGNLVRVAGLCGTAGNMSAGPALSSRLRNPWSIAVDRHDDLYISDRDNQYLEKVTEPASGAGTLSVIAGDGTYGELPGTTTPALSPSMSSITSVAVDASMNVYLVDVSPKVGRIAGVASVPDPPTGLSATAGTESLTLSFSPPSDDGGATLTGYESSINSGSSWQTLSSTGAGPVTATLSGLTGGTAYTVAVRARNTVGASTGSNTVTAAPEAPRPPTPPPTPVALTSTGTGPAGQHATVTLASGETLTLLHAGLPASTVTVAGVGAYSVTTNVITFTPAPGFAGTTAGVSFQVTNAAGATGTALYTPTVTAPEPPAPANLISTGPAAQQTAIDPGAGTASLLDAAGEPATTVTVAGEGTYVLDLETTLLTFTPMAGFTGAATGVVYRVTDLYRQHGDARYTPTVVPAPAPTLLPLPKIDRSALVNIPANPRSVTGAERRTKAFNSSFTGADAYPISQLGTRTLVKGQATTLTGAGLFQFNKGALTLKGRQKVKTAVDNLKGVKNMHCEGYTDYVGVRSHQLTLSLQRAKAVCAALRTYGVRAVPMTRGYGPQRPAVIGGTRESRAENRRFVILVTG